MFSSPPQMEADMTTRREKGERGKARSARASALNEDRMRWEENQLVKSGAARVMEVDTDFSNEEENRVHVIVHDVQPPFLEGPVTLSNQAVSHCLCFLVDIIPCSNAYIYYYVTGNGKSVERSNGRSCSYLQKGKWVAQKNARAEGACKGTVKYSKRFPLRKTCPIFPANYLLISCSSFMQADREHLSMEGSTLGNIMGVVKAPEKAVCATTYEFCHCFSSFFSLSAQMLKL
jgi:hypothetical protein